MSISTITIPLPDTVLRRAQQAANALHRSLAEVLAATLAAGLPDVGDAPDLLQAELAGMTWLSDPELWSIAQGTLTVSQRHVYGRTTLRKARAFALLSLRGGRPLLASDS